MKKLFAILAMLFVCATAHAQHIDTSNTLPTSNSSFIPDLQNFLNKEDANRYSEQGFASMVVSGGLHTTGAGLTKTPTALIAYPGGYRITEAGSITYPANRTCYVLADNAITGNVSTYVRVAGTHYLIDCTSVSEPAQPSASVRLMTVVTDGTSVTAVTDRRITSLSGSTGGGATSDSKYIIETTDALLPNAFALGSLGTGILKNTTITGVPSIASPDTDYVTPTGSGAGLTSLNASSLASGTVPPARLGSGTADNTTFLRGDSTWGTVAGAGTVTSVGVVGTSNQITVTGASPITNSGSFTLSIPTNPTLPGTTTGTFSGNITGNVTGNASTATALAANGTNCGAGEAAAGVDASGNAEGCFTPAGSGSAPALDLGNDASNESSGLALIATTGDTNSAFTLPSANKLLIDLSKRWPASDTAVALAANPTNCASGTFPLGVAANGTVENCTALPTTIAGTPNQITASASTGAITLSIPTNPTLPGTTTGTFSGPLTGNASTATALAANGANCAVGSAPLGVDASGAAEGCFDVATQAELDAHTTSTSAHSATSANTASRIVLRDGSGNFAAGSITANLVGTVTGNASTATLATTATTANALATAGWIPPVVTVATLPASPTNGQEVTVSDGASAGACETGLGTNRTRCQFNSTSGHWEPAIPAAASSSLQTAKDAGATINNSVDLATCVKIGNGTIFHCLFADSSNVLQQAATDASGTVIPIDKITKADANKTVQVQDSSGTPVFTVTDTSGVGAITAAKGLVGGFSLPIVTGSVLTATDDAVNYIRIPYAQTITQVCAKTDTGTISVQLQRDDGSTTNMLSSSLVGATTEACTTSFVSGENVLSEGNYVDVLIVSIDSGSPTRLTVSAKTARN